MKLDLRRNPAAHATPNPTQAARSVAQTLGAPFAPAPAPVPQPPPRDLGRARTAAARGRPKRVSMLVRLPPTLRELVRAKAARTGLSENAVLTASIAAFCDAR